MAVLKERNKIKPSLTILLSSSSLPPKKKPMQKLSDKYFSAMGPYLCLLEHLFCLSHHKTNWTMSLYNVSLITCHLGIDFDLHYHFDIFFPFIVI